MKAKNAPLLIVAVVLVAGIGGAIIYGINQGGNKTDNQTGMQKGDHNNGEHSSAPVDTANAKETDSVEIKNFAFAPTAIKVKVGTKVTWTNQDSVQHDVVGDSFKDLKGPLLKQGESYSYTFDKAGSYSYHCTPHPYMKGTVIVTE